MEDRIDTEITLGYIATNSKGQKTIELEPAVLKIKDQSQQAASAHLSAVVGGLLAPAQAQAR